VITGDLDAELLVAAAAIVPDAPLPSMPATWRPAPDGDPARYATSLPFELARHTGRPPAELAAALGARLTGTGWISDLVPSKTGFLTITVTSAALGDLAARIVRAGPACVHSSELRARSVILAPWPDPAAARTWRQAWQDQADAMAGRLAEAAGAAGTAALGRERGRAHPRPAGGAQSPVASAVAYFGTDPVRYGLARTLPGRVGRLASVQQELAEYRAVQLAHAAAASTARWAADLGIRRPDPEKAATWLLGAPAERELLGLLSWFPVRVAAGARRHRPAELPHYLEQVATAWTTARLACPALPFGGAAAAADPDLAGARLLLAQAAAIVLATGMAMTGVEPAARAGDLGVSG